MATEAARTARLALSAAEHKALMTDPEIKSMPAQEGKRGERKLATELREAFPDIADDIRRGWQSRNGDDEPDVVLPIPGYWLEHKSGAKPNPRAALSQAIQDSGGRAMPIAVIRDDRKAPFAVVRWSDLLSLMVALRALGGPANGKG